MIVRSDDYERHLFDGGDIQAFVRRTGLHSTFSNRGQTDKSFLASPTFGHE